MRIKKIINNSIVCAVDDTGDESFQFLREYGVVGVQSYHWKRNKRVDEERCQLELHQRTYFVRKDLFCIFDNLRVFFEYLFALLNFALEPWVGLAYFPVKDYGVDDAANEFNGKVNVETTKIDGEYHLQDYLACCCDLEIACYYVVALVGREECRMVVDKIANH